MIINLFHNSRRGRLISVSPFATIRKRVACGAIVGVISIMSSFSVQADDNFWQSPFDYSSVEVVDVESGRDVSFASTQGLSYDYTETGAVSLGFNQAVSSNSSYAMEYSQAQEQSTYMLGLTHNNLSVSYIQGEGEDYAELAGSYAGINPYQFHAGLRQDYNYDGYAFDYALRNFGHVQFGQATVSADNLLDRKVSYFEWSNDRLFLRASEYDRGGDSIGNGFDMGLAFGANKHIAYQTMQLDNGATMNRVRLQLNANKSQQYWVDLSSQHHPLYQDSADSSIMFSFKTILGANKLVNYAAESKVTGVDEEGVDAPNKSSRWKRPVFIGASVGAIALLASSGDEDRDDNTTRFANQTDAAFDVLNRVNPLSVQQNIEYGGWVVINPDGSYSPTATVTGDNDSVTIPGSLIPAGTNPTASVHTHAAFDPRFDNENFSPADIDGDNELMLDGYLATPGGQFKFHNHETNSITTLGSIAN